MKRGLNRLMRFALEEQRLADAVDLGDLDVGDPVDDAADPMALAERRRLLLPVAPHAVAQALGLADVQHVAPGVLHQVDAGSIGQSLEGRLEFGGHPPMLGQVPLPRRQCASSCVAFEAVARRRRQVPPAPSASARVFAASAAAELERERPSRQAVDRRGRPCSSRSRASTCRARRSSVHRPSRAACSDRRSAAARREPAGRRRRLVRACRRRTAAP